MYIFLTLEFTLYLKNLYKQTSKISQFGVMKMHINRRTNKHTQNIVVWRYENAYKPTYKQTLPRISQFGVMKMHINKYTRKHYPEYRSWRYENAYKPAYKQTLPRISQFGVMKMRVKHDRCKELQRIFQRYSCIYYFFC